MKHRPSFEEIYMNLAYSLADRSTCKRLSVGAVITSTDYRYVYAIGYNGNASGMQNCCDRDEIGNCGCLHAEDNAVINCTCSRETPKIVFVTVNPCVMCAKRLINMGNIKKVYYSEPYRLSDSLLILEQAGIEVIYLERCE